MIMPLLFTLPHATLTNKEFKRQIGNGNPSSNSSTGFNLTALLVGFGAVGGLLFLALVYWLIARHRGRRKSSNSDRNKQSSRVWTLWGRRLSGYRTTDQLESRSESSTLGTGRSSRIQLTSTTTNNGASGTHPDEPVSAGVDRNTSVRSVMTLPAYKSAPGESEQVLGREGERGGIDVVIEYPETVDEIEEQRRDEEMEALYQVRLARRTETAERENLRRLRREARERGDMAALDELRARSRIASGARATRTLEELREDHRRLRDRPRAVSSVSYADLGVASHDGTRIRANSEESERPLLGDAASMSSSHFHRRDRSASSVLSIDSDLPSPSLTRSRADSRAESSLRRGIGGNMSSPELIDAEQDLGDPGFPMHSPPEYEDIALGETTSRGAPAEDPPEYHSPIATRGPEPRWPGEGAHNRQGSSSSAGLGIGSSNPASPAESGERRLSGSGSGSSRGRGVGGIPQLPSLRLSTLPSIIVEGATPISGNHRSLGMP